MIFERQLIRALQAWMVAFFMDILTKDPNDSYRKSWDIVFSQARRDQNDVRMSVMNSFDTIMSRVAIQFPIQLSAMVAYAEKGLSEANDSKRAMLLELFSI